ncbi:hypothetical protein D9758_005802 [Tetrapyrgos nigripes]|uniref:Enoyl reductase (ER) domain-containing protein n=1 Tax=Tetrapyrgos nigripes TaxID=182062 RepID=A0A8H5GJR8_9AGAR|nr:hypothetical protein D9758_005802 [Tetrapyrgos nigripes]
MNASSSSSSPPQTQTQTAWTYTTQGLPRQILSINHNYPVPPPPSGTDLFIRVTHISLNPGCYITLEAIPTWVRRLVSGGKTEYVPEGEFSGIVVSVGSDVGDNSSSSSSTPSPSSDSNADPKFTSFQQFKPGTRVFGCLPVPSLLGGSGTLAQFISVPSTQVCVVPSKNMTMAEAAGLSGAGLTAWAMLNEVPGYGVSEIEREGSKPRVFINGGSGGVGTMLIQLAKAQGAYVVATCSERSRELVKSLGTDEVIDYRANSPLPEYLSRHYSSASTRFTHILDTIGSQSLFESCASYLESTGVYINVGNFEGIFKTVFRAFWNEWAEVRARWGMGFIGGVPRTYKMISTTPNGAKAAILAKMVEEGKLRVVVDEVVGFHAQESDGDGKGRGVLDAYDRMLARNVMGKIVVKVQNP